MSSESFESDLRQAQVGAPAARLAFLAGRLDTLRLAAKRAAVRGPLLAKVGESDLTQVSLIIAADKLPQFRGSTEEALERWLNRIVVRHAIDLTRTHRRRDERPLRDASASGNGNSLAGKDRTPSSIVSREEEADRVRQAVNQLPIHYRTVIQFRNFDKLSFTEIGKRLNLTPNASRMIWVRSIDRLKELLGPDP